MISWLVSILTVWKTMLLTMLENFCVVKNPMLCEAASLAMKFLICWLQLKTEYFSSCDSYQLVNEEITFCEQFVAKSRQRLLEEFDKWYKECFIKQEEKNKSEESVSQGTDSIKAVKQFNHTTTVKLQSFTFAMWGYHIAGGCNWPW